MVLLAKRVGSVRIDGDTTIRNHRFEFSVTKTLTPEINQASIQFTNLPRSIRRQLSVKGIKFEIFAGYEERQSRIFTGNSTHTESFKSGPTWLTIVVCGDGSESQKVFVNDSFAADATIVDVVRALAAKLPVDASNLEAQIAAGLFDGTQRLNLQNGYVTQGQALDALNKIIVGAGGIRWSIQDGELVFLPRSGLLSQPVEQVNPIIDFPRSLEEGGVAVRTLLNTAFRPGAPVVVDDQDVHVEGRIERVVYTGDNRGDSWFADLEIVNVSDPDFNDIDALLLP